MRSPVWPAITITRDNPSMRDAAIVHTQPDTLITTLSQHGYRGIACPVLSIESVPFALADPYDVAIITSRHAIPFVPVDMPIVAVGEETAETARENGVPVLAVGNGDIASLKDVDVFHNKRIVHLCGRHTSPGSETIMNALGAHRVCVYEARLNPDFPVSVKTSLEQEKLGAVLMFSARAARHFTGLAKRATNNDLWRSVTGVALSPRIAAAMDGLPFADVRVASAPNRNALLEALIT